MKGEGRESGTDPAGGETPEGEKPEALSALTGGAGGSGTRNAERVETLGADVPGEAIPVNRRSAGTCWKATNPRCGER